MTTSALSFTAAICLIVATAAEYDHSGTVIHFSQDIDTRHPQQIGFKPEHRDWGYIKKCGPPGGYFNISWTPKNFHYNDQLQIRIHVVMPIDFDSGKLNATLWYEGSPVFNILRKMTCTEATAALDALTKLTTLKIQCPIRKGQLLIADYHITNLERMRGLEGTFAVTATLSDDKGRQLLCVEAELEVLPFEPY